jgi:hypothetical protein
MQSIKYHCVKFYVTTQLLKGFRRETRQGFVNYFRGE